MSSKENPTWSNNPDEAVPAPLSRGERVQRWVTAAVDGELETLSNFEGNPNKPDSGFFGCLLRIAAVIKGSRQSVITKEEAERLIIQAVSGKDRVLTEREIRRQFRNAWRMARPRRLQD